MKFKTNLTGFGGRQRSPAKSKPGGCWSAHDQLHLEIIFVFAFVFVFVFAFVFVFVSGSTHDQLHNSVSSFVTLDSG